MKFNVHMLAFWNGEIRVVDVPDYVLSVKHTGPDRKQGRIDYILSRVFYYGQNDFQPQPMPSVSVGDVLELEGELYVVAVIGFRKISPEQLAALKAMSQEERIAATLQENIREALKHD